MPDKVSSSPLSARIPRADDVPPPDSRLRPDGSPLAGARNASTSGVWQARPVVVADRASPVVIELEERPSPVTPAGGRAGTVVIPMHEVPSAAAPIAADRARPVAIPIGDPDPPQKPGLFDFRLRQVQSEKTEDVRRKALHEALSSLKENEIDRPVGDLVARIAARLPKENAQAERLSTVYGELQEQLRTLDTAFEDFLTLRIKQTCSSFPALCDVKTLFLGNSITALLLRSSIQSALIALSGGAIQYFTYLILDHIAANDPEAIPQDIIDGVIGARGGADESPALARQIEDHLALVPEDDLAELAGMNEGQIDKLARKIGDEAAESLDSSVSALTPDELVLARSAFANPASSIINADNSSRGLIYGTEIVYNCGTGSARSISGHLVEKRFQKQELHNSLAFQRAAPTILERAGTAARKSAIRQTATGLTGFAIGSLANIAGKSASGAPVKDIFKDVGAMALVQAATSVSHVGADALHGALLPSDKHSEYCQQAARVAMRTVCSLASQYLKTGLYARFNDRSALGIGDHVRALMTGGLGGLGRETVSAAAALLTSRQAPADLDYSVKAAGTIGSFTELLRALNDKALSEALSGASLEQERAALFERLTAIVRPLQEAEKLKPSTGGIKQEWERFDAYLHETIRERRGPGPHNV